MTRPDLIAKADATFAAANTLATMLVKGVDLRRQDLIDVMQHAHGTGAAEGAWSIRDAFDALEIAQVLTHRGACSTAREKASLAELLDRQSRLPAHTVRSEAQIAFQQFSTPSPIAFLASTLLDAVAGCRVLEPSAGTGLLACHADRPEITLILNERDPWRAALLARTFTNRIVTTVDAEILVDQVEAARHVDRVLLNPPFSRSEGRGHDALAGYRHLRAALRSLTANGRCVAILPSWYDSASTAWRTATAGYRALFTVALPDNAYAAHGTSISVKLVCLEKGDSSDAPMIQAASLETALDAIRAVPQAQPPTPRVEAKPSLFSKARAQTMKPAFVQQRTTATRSTIACHPLTYDLLDAPAPSGEAAGLYLAYRPSRIAIPGAIDHPTPLVESNAMGSIAAPIPTYHPMIPPHVVAKGLLSKAQLETLIYAGEAFEHDITYTPTSEPADTTTDTTPPELAHPYRGGFFLGDGTGAGKGRQVAAIILDQWWRGRRKAVWVSMTEALLEDARRDWCDLGGLQLDLQHLNTWKIGTPIDAAAGIIFLTYATLRSDRGEGGSRSKQLIDWLGDDFDGVIVFDEAHAMANAAGGEALFGKAKGSEQGIAGLRLQDALPRARVLYVSATGASDVNKLAYAARLGLWGEGTAFATRSNFVERVRSGGVAAMEVVARDLKALGLYFARALSYAGVEYDPLEHRLTTEQICVYDAYADAFAVIHDNLETALDAARVTDSLAGTTLNKGALAAAKSAFESTKQRFFGALLLAMKLPSLVPAIEQDLAAGAAVVIQLVSTGQAMLDRQLAGLSDEDRAEPDIELSPREHVIGYLERAFPTRMMEMYLDDEGEQRSRPMSDEDGNPVFSQAAIEARDAMIEQLCAMPAVGSALDHLIARFGTNDVAEVTARTRRIIVEANGRQRIETRSCSANIAETQAFMRGDKRIIAFSNAGGTGRSYHASLRAKNQARRHHYLLEPGWRADAAIQGLGRTHRTEQASAPLFKPVSTDCRGERRFLSTIARRLDAMGAITRGQRQTGGQGMFNPRDNLESDYAKDALLAWYKLLHDGKLASTSFEPFCKLSGLKLAGPDGALLVDLPPIQRWLNRILALRIATQNAIFDEFLGLIEARIEAARAAGTLDLGVETIAADRITILKRTVVRTDARSGAETILLEVETEQALRPLPLADILRLAETAQPAINTRSGKPALIHAASSITTDDGRTVRRFRLQRPTRSETMTNDALEESAWRPTNIEAFSAAWAHELDELHGKTRIERLHLITGLLLPVWTALDNDHVQIWRLVTQDGQSVLGRIIPPALVERVTRTLGTQVVVELSAAEIIAHVLDRGDTLSVGGYRVKRARVAGEYRLELLDWDVTRLATLKAIGLFSEIIAHKTRLFIPTTNAAPAMLDRIRDIAPPQVPLLEAA